jgi:hypothetical protein
MTIGDGAKIYCGDALAVLGVSVTSLRRMKQRKALRYHRFGGVVNFSPDDLDWMKRNFAVLEAKA